MLCSRRAAHICHHTSLCIIKGNRCGVDEKERWGQNISKVAFTFSCIIGWLIVLILYWFCPDIILILYNFIQTLYKFYEDGIKIKTRLMQTNIQIPLWFYLDRSLVKIWIDVYGSFVIIYRKLRHYNPLLNTNHTIGKNFKKKSPLKKRAYGSYESFRIILQ